MTACIAEIINTGGNSVFEVRAMGRNKKSRDEAAPEFTSGNWTEDDSRELQLMLMADELATIAYRTVDWRDVAVLGRAIVALAEKAAPQSMK